MILTISGVHKWILSMDLNEASDEHERILMCNEYHKRGADTEKALFPQDRDVFGPVRRCLSAKRKPEREEVCGTTSSKREHLICKTIMCKLFICNNILKYLNILFLVSSQASILLGS